MLRAQKLGPTYRTLAWMVRSTFGLWTRVRLEGAENLPVHAPCIIAANHRSYLDPPLICAYLLPVADCMISPAATKGLFVGPGGWILRGMDAFVIDREGKRNLGAVRGMVRRLKDQHPILIFPEGGIPEPEDRWTCEPGVGFAAAYAKVPVVPVAIHNAENALPDGSWFVRPKRITIRVGAPFDVTHDKDHKAVSLHIMSEIRKVYDGVVADYGEA